MLTNYETLVHQVFSTTWIFQGLSTQATTHIASHFRRREFPKNSFLFHEQEPARIYYLIAEGRVKITQTSASGFQVILHVLGPGDLIGALPTLGEGNYPASAEAISDLTAYSIEATLFDSLLRKYSILTLNLLRFATGKLQATHRRLQEMSTERVERRIAHTLGRLASQVGNRVEEGILLDAPLSRQDLAEMCGTTLFTVSRTLKKWERQGWIIAGREEIIITRPHSLAMLADDLPQPSPKQSN